LVDIPLQGGQFTWSNNQVWSKIDRFLLSPEWKEHYSDVSKILCIKIMDMEALFIAYTLSRIVAFTMLRKPIEHLLLVVFFCIIIIIIIFPYMY